MNSYVAMEAAVPLSCYYPETENPPIESSLVLADVNSPTPKYAQRLGYHGYLSDIGGNMNNRVSYYNQLDFWLMTGTLNPSIEIAMGTVVDQALHWPLGSNMVSLAFNIVKNVDWITNQKRKPDNRIGNGRYKFDTIPRFFTGPYTRPVADPHEGMSFVARSRTRPLGGGEPPPDFQDLNLKEIYRFDDQRSCHSGQFQRNIQLMYGNNDGIQWSEPFYHRMMSDLRVSPN